MLFILVPSMEKKKKTAFVFLLSSLELVTGAKHTSGGAVFLKVTRDITPTPNFSVQSGTTTGGNPGLLSVLCD